MVKQTLNYYEAPRMDVIHLDFRESVLNNTSPNGPVNAEDFDGDDEETIGG